MKRSYDKPELVVYGDIRQITAAAAAGTADGGMGMGTDKSGGEG